MSTLYADDPEVHAEYQITDRDGDDVIFDPVATTDVDGVATELTTTWVGDPAATRIVKIDLYGLEVGAHALRLNNPDGNDIKLGNVYLY